MSLTAWALLAVLAAALAACVLAFVLVARAGEAMRQVDSGPRAERRSDINERRERLRRLQGRGDL